MSPPNVPASQLIFTDIISQGGLEIGNETATNALPRSSLWCLNLAASNVAR